jgi:hypothetical protein
MSEAAVNLPANRRGQIKQHAEKRLGERYDGPPDDMVRRVTRKIQKHLKGIGKKEFQRGKREGARPTVDNVDIQCLGDHKRETAHWRVTIDRVDFTVVYDRKRKIIKTFYPPADTQRVEQRRRGR